MENVQIGIVKAYCSKKSKNTNMGGRGASSTHYHHHSGTIACISAIMRRSDLDTNCSPVAPVDQASDRMRLQIVFVIQQRATPSAIQ